MTIDLHLSHFIAKNAIIAARIFLISRSTFKNSKNLKIEQTKVLSYECYFYLISICIPGVKNRGFHVPWLFFVVERWKKTCVALWNFFIDPELCFIHAFNRKTLPNSKLSTSKGSIYLQPLLLLSLQRIRPLTLRRWNSVLFSKLFN